MRAGTITLAPILHFIALLLRFVAPLLHFIALEGRNDHSCALIALCFPRCTRAHPHLHPSRSNRAHLLRLIARLLRPYCARLLPAVHPCSSSPPPPPPLSLLLSSPSLTSLPHLRAPFPPSPPVRPSSPSLLSVSPPLPPSPLVRPACEPVPGAGDGLVAPLLRPMEP